MNKTKQVLYYSKYISFIIFLYAAIILYPGLILTTIGKICLMLITIYSLTTLIMFIKKSHVEQYSILNNMVLCFLHLYLAFIAYKYQLIGNIVNASQTYFSLNYLITCISLFVLTINKFILSSLK